MPSGNTHILLLKYLPEDQLNDDLLSILHSGKYFLYAGAVAPDLPYASIADSDFILSSQTGLADKFHYEKTNQIPLLAFYLLRMNKEYYKSTELDYSFSFFVGYMSHIIADGVMHPFVRDVVGDYNTNSDAHRELEMKLDVLLFHNWTKQSGIAQDLDRSKIFECLQNVKSYEERDIVMGLFSKTIYSIYNEQYSNEKILDWLYGLHNLFKASSGEYPQVFRQIDFIKTYLTPHYDEIKNDADNIFTLERPKDNDYNENFLKRPKVHFLLDCVPKFYDTFIPLMKKAYSYVYEDGEAITKSDLFEIDLDTGRPIAQKNNMELTPTFWS